MASVLSSNGYISAHFDNIHIKLSTHAYFEVRFHFMLSKYENSRLRFYDITDELNLTSDRSKLRSIQFLSGKFSVILLANNVHRAT